MAILIGLGLSGTWAQTGTEAPPAIGAVATVAPMPAVNAIFDSGAARGSNAAEIPLTGSTDAVDGAQIEARIVRADTGAQVHPWAAIATAAGGAWSGAFPAAQRSAHRLRAEVRVQGSTAPAATMAGDFMVGHVFAIIGQSEDERMFSPTWDKPEQGPVPAFANAAAEDSVFYLAKGESVPVAINSTNPRSRAVAHLANTLTRNAPGEKFLIFNATRSGASYRDFGSLVRENMSFEDDFNQRLQVIKDWGSTVGVIGSTWTAAPSFNADLYRRYHYPFITGKYAAEDGGGTYTKGDTIIIAGNPVSSFIYDDIMWDLTGAGRGVLEADESRFFLYGPHRFEDNYVGANGFYNAGGYATSYTSDVLPADNGILSGDLLRVYTVDATGNTSVVIEGSPTGAFAGEETTVFSGSGHIEDVLSAAFAFYRLTTVGGGRYGLRSNAGGALQDTKRQTRQSIRNWVADPDMAPIMLPKGPEILAYQQGSAIDVPIGTGGNEDKVATDDPNAIAWTDLTHPSDVDPDGLPARARHTAIAMLHAFQTGPAAAQNRWVPRINRSQWTTEYVEVWYEAPDGSTPAITTTRLARGEDPIGNTYDHWTDVMGFWINGQPAQRAEIVGGRVRVYPDGFKTAFDNTDVIEFGKGGASATVLWPQDYFAEHWKNLPIVPMGFESAEGLDGVALEPLPDPADLINDLAGVTPLILDGSQPLASPVLGSSLVNGQVTYQGYLKFDASLRTVQTIFGQASGPILLEWVNGSMRLNVKDSSGRQVVSNESILDVMPSNVYKIVTLSIDLATDTVKLWVGEPGTATEFPISINLPSNSQLNAGRQFVLASGGQRGEMQFAQMWLGSVAATGPDLGTYVDGVWVDGADGIGAPYKRIEADASGTMVQLGTAPAW